MTPISFFSNNVYQIPWIYVEFMVRYRKLLFVDSCTDQAVRCSRVSELAINHDIVTLQEMWGSELHTLQQALIETHTSLARHWAWCGLIGSGVLANLFNMYWADQQRNGGLFLAVKQEFLILWEVHHNFHHNEGEEYMFKSVSVVLLDVSKRWGEHTYLLIANTHLHAPNPYGDSEIRRLQRQEISQILIDIQTIQSYPEDFSWSKCGGLIMGDFNTAFKLHSSSIDSEKHSSSLTREYKDTLKMFGEGVAPLRDLFIECHPNIDNNIHSYSAANYYVSQYCVSDTSRMDYIFAMDQLPTNTETPVSLLPLVARNCDYIVAEHGYEGSDHYPLTASVEPR